MSENANCNSRYFAILKLHARQGARGSVGAATTDASNYLVSCATLDEAKKSVESHLCRNGYNAYPYKVYIIDQETNTIAAHVGVDPAPVIGTQWVESKAAKS